MKEKIEITQGAVCQLTDFFNLLGYDDWARELEKKWDAFAEKKEALFNRQSETAAGHNEFLFFNAMETRMAEYTNALGELKVTFDYYIGKIKILTEADAEKEKGGAQ